MGHLLFCIEENLAAAATLTNTRLWFDNERPIAWAYVDDFNNLCWDIDKRYEELLGAQVIQWGN